ncbi:protein FAM222B [Austrofundulus limnaeus]|uniref:Protein FAM222B-like n=1 Tax=Austrofundulus limnaeus TaxID=52670 RepID=A0A2I4BUG0_AUSLI|nr:PREDICTED: protein FAM222B-like [Austrofundulus limnaeus]XP_013871361.1 PREDICTED: protein FAM222B-like [Austrofundulus limnaeus]
MLACLPASGDPTFRFLPRTQMNTGLQKWETTQKMRSAIYPTPAELDAYAKKVANNPLTIQIFPNSVKVPQRKHIRRTVNGLDTSLSSQRHSPYASQVTTRGGLLAVLRAPIKTFVKESHNSRTRQQQKSAMNPQSGPYAAQSTLNLPHAAPHLAGPSQPAAQKQGMVHSQAIQHQTMTQPMALQHHHPHALQQRGMAHSEALQRQQSMTQVQRLAHPQALQRQQSLPHSQALQQQQGQSLSQALQQQQGQSHSQALQQQQGQSHSQALQQQQGQSCASVLPQQHLSHVQTLKHPTAPPQAALTQQGVTQDLRHLSDGGPHPQGLVSLQALPHAVPTGPATVSSSLQQPPTGQYGSRKLPDVDSPPNVTVSTSTIPLSMAASLYQNRVGDLSSIVQQINQLCQARAGMGATSVCEGQIANPSPISRNLLINASSRVSSQHSGLGNGSSCLMGGHPDKAAAQTPGGTLHSQPAAAAPNSAAAFHADSEKVQLQHHLHQQKQQQLQQLQQLQQQRSWAQHQLAHMQQPPEGVHPCKNPRMEPPIECAFPSQNLSYAHKLPNAAQGFPLKHPTEKTHPSPTVTCPAASYANGHYMQPPWSGIPTTAGNNGNVQDLPAAYQGGQAASTNRIPGAKYRPGKEGPPGQSKLMQRVDFLNEDFHLPSLQDQNLDMIQKMHRSAMGQVKEPGSSGSVHHPGYH